MPTGIIMQSSSKGATQEDIEKVLIANGYEPEKKDDGSPETPAEPKREDFKTDEEFEAAQEQFEDAQEANEEAAADKAEKERLAVLPKKSRKQKAIEKATRELREENAKLAERLTALEGKGGKNKSEAAVPKLEAPKREDFDTDEEFDEAKFQYRYQLQRQREQEEDSKNALKTRLEKNFNDYKTAAADFREEHDDWDEVTGQKINIPESVYYAIVDLADEGPAVTYYLGKHPDKIAELAELTPYRAAIEVGRLADQLKTGADPKKTTEKAPKIPPKKIPDPVKPVSTSATTSTLTSTEAAKRGNYKEFKAAQRRGV